METNKIHHAVMLAQECAVNTIEDIHHANRHGILDDDEIDRVRDSMQTLLYCKELLKDMQK